MHGIVWGNTYEIAKQQLDDIISNYKKDNILVLFKRQNKNEYSVVFENRDYWEAIKVNENQRGRKCNVSYIDKDIPHEMVEKIIFPSTIASPYSAMAVYGRG